MGYGIRVPAGVDLTLTQRCAALAQRLPASAVFSHVTAARLHALPLPHTTDDRRFDVCVPTADRAPRGVHVRGHRAKFRAGDASGEGDVDRRAGVAATSPARTFCDLADSLDLAALVAIGDTLVRRTTGLHTRDELARLVERYPGRRSTRRLRRAMELLDEDAESPKESELRVVLIEAGFPPPVTQHAVFDGTGRFVARVDLAYPTLKIAIEYEGDHHRDKVQWRKDLQRRRRLEALGWVYLSVTQADLTSPADMLSDLGVAIAGQSLRPGTPIGGISAR